MEPSTKEHVPGVPMAATRSIKLTVPLVPQRLGNSCWYAAACMVSYYFRAGPRLGLPAKWQENKGITPKDFIELAKTEGLLPLATTHQTNNSLYQALRYYGPIWSAGFWYGPGHVIVLTGIEGDTVYLNDPDGGVAKSGTVAWFNTKLAKLPGAMMRKDPHRS